MSPLAELEAVLRLASTWSWAEVFNRVDGLARSYFLDEFFSDVQQVKKKMPRNRAEVVAATGTVERTNTTTPEDRYPPEVYSGPRMVEGKLSSFSVDGVPLEMMVIPLGNSDDATAVAHISVGTGVWVKVVMASPSVVANPAPEVPRRYQEVSGGALAITHDRGQFIDDYEALQMFRTAKGDMFCVQTVAMDKDELAAVTVTGISTVDLPDSAELIQLGEQFRAPALRLHWTTHQSLASAIESAKEPTHPVNANVFDTMTDYMAESGGRLIVMPEHEPWWTPADTDRLRKLARLADRSTTGETTDPQHIRAIILERLNESFASLLRVWDTENTTDQCLDNLVTITRSLTTHQGSTSDAVTTALKLLNQ